MSNPGNFLSIILDHPPPPKKKDVYIYIYISGGEQLKKLLLLLTGQSAPNLRVGDRGCEYKKSETKQYTLSRLIVNLANQTYSVIFMLNLGEVV